MKLQQSQALTSHFESFWSIVLQNQSDFWTYYIQKLVQKRRVGSFPPIGFESTVVNAIHPDTIKVAPN